jgi:hypothetical protein
VVFSGITVALLIDIGAKVSAREITRFFGEYKMVAGHPVQSNAEISGESAVTQKTGQAPAKMLLQFYQLPDFCQILDLRLAGIFWVEWPNFGILAPLCR